MSIGNSFCTKNEYGINLMLSIAAILYLSILHMSKYWLFFITFTIIFLNIIVMSKKALNMHAGTPCHTIPNYPSQSSFINTM